MRATLRNLEKYEAIVNNTFSEGEKLGVTLREAVYTIKAEHLWEAVESDEIHNFETYLASSRLKLGYRNGKYMALNGEIEREAQKGTAVPFSDFALRACHTIREEVNGHKTHKLDMPKIKRVLKKAESLARQANETPSEKHIRQAKELVLNQAPKPFDEQLEAKIRIGRIYNLRKKKQGGDRKSPKSRGQLGPFDSKTADKVAEETNTSSRSVKRNGHRAAVYDVVESEYGKDSPEAKLVLKAKQKTIEDILAKDETLDAAKVVAKVKRVKTKASKERKQKTVEAKPSKAMYAISETPFQKLLAQVKGRGPMPTEEFNEVLGGVLPVGSVRVRTSTRR